MALKKSELYSSIWSSCDELRGGMDASQYKDYVLVLFFMKYVSDKYAGQTFAPILTDEVATMDASQYKDYVLVLFFMKYVSDKYAGQTFAPILTDEVATLAAKVDVHFRRMGFAV